jgi:hypothetical protein
VHLLHSVGSMSATGRQLTIGSSRRPVGDLRRPGKELERTVWCAHNLRVNGGPLQIRLVTSLPAQPLDRTKALIGRVYSSRFALV